MGYHKDFQAQFSQRIFRITLTGLGLLVLIAVLLTAILEHQVLRLEEPLEERKKLEVEESQDQTHGNNI